MTKLRIKEALKKYHKIEIELLLAHVLKKPKEFLFMNPDKSLSAGQLISLSALVKRREKGEPIAYIVGYKDFMGLRFMVNKNVLIPRPETEWVIDRVSAVFPSFLRRGGLNASEGRGGWRLQDNYSNPSVASKATPSLKKGRKLQGAIKILDVGTGSGAIIISLAKTLTLPSPRGRGKLQLYASDISPAALKVARQNAKFYKAPVKFIKSDLLKNTKDDFDIIIANLPYLAPVWSSANLKYEPKQALFTKEKGLMLIRRLLNQIADKPKKPRLIYVEFDPRQKRELSALIKKSLPGSKAKFYKDYNNFWRYAEISCVIPGESDEPRNRFKSLVRDPSAPRMRSSVGMTDWLIL